MNNENIPLDIRKNLWTKYYNNYNTTTCFCGCGRIIPADDFILKHIFNQNKKMINYEASLAYGYITEKFNNNQISINNLRPICNICLKEMKSLNLYDYCYSRNYICREDNEYDPMDICYDECNINNNNNMIID